MRKIITVSLILVSILSAGGNKSPIDKKHEIRGFTSNESNLTNKDNFNSTQANITDKDDFEFISSEGSDLRGFSFYNTDKCFSFLHSGILEIKNKNHDYDLNAVFFRHGRITYVLPDSFSENQSKCFGMIQTKELDIINLRNLFLTLGSTK